jgi:hypothetical protein
MVAVAVTGWILALHLLSAFALIGALTILTISFVAARRIDAGRPSGSDR